MNEGSPSERDESSATANPDEQYAETFLAGYSEGARAALKEVLAQAARGHTVGELRMLVQSRLAHLPEELELRRRRLLAVPRTSPWQSLLPRRGPPRPWTGGSPEPRVAPGSHILVREERPRRAVALAQEAAPRFSRVLVVSSDPPAFPRVAAESLRVFSVGSADAGPTLESIAGQMGREIPPEGGGLIYVDALETIALKDGPDTAVRFVLWLLDRARDARCAVVAAVHPRVLPPKDEGLLERAFQVVL